MLFANETDEFIKITTLLCIRKSLNIFKLSFTLIYLNKKKIECIEEILSSFSSWLRYNT